MVLYACILCDRKLNELKLPAKPDLSQNTSMFYESEEHAYYIPINEEIGFGFNDPSEIWI